MVARDEDSIGPTGRLIITQFPWNVKSVTNSDKSVTQRALHSLQRRALCPSASGCQPRMLLSGHAPVPLQSSRMHTVPGLASLR
jgi:hypothetical protein